MYKAFNQLPLLLLCCLSTFWACKKEQKVEGKARVIETNLFTLKTGDTTLPTSPEDLATLINYGKPHSDAQYSVADFFRNPNKTKFQLSPNGEFISYLAPYKNRLNIFIKPIDGVDSIRLTKEINYDIKYYRWANDNQLVYVKNEMATDNYQIIAVNKDTKKHKSIAPFPDCRITLIDPLSDQPNHIIIGINKRDKRVFDAYKVDLASGDIDLLIKNPGQIAHWIADNNGELRVAIENDGVNTSILYRNSGDSVFTSIIKTDFRESVAPFFFAANNKDFYAISNRGRDKSVVVLIDGATGKEIGRPIFEHPHVDVLSITQDPRSKALLLAFYATERRQVHFFSNDAKSLYQRLLEKVGNYEVEIVDHTIDASRFLVKTYSDKSLGNYYLYDNHKDSLVHLANSAPWLNEADMAPMKSISYLASDGLPISGYLTYPTNGKTKDIPVVVYPHEGPWTRDFWGFDPTVQLLASKGYGVLQINYRGSWGFGRAFWEASFGEWGKNMQQDITDGVVWLVENEIADKNKVSIFGKGYGGYTALMGLSNNPDKYACGISYAGSTNLFTLLSSFPPYWEPFKEMMYTMVGDPNDPSDSVALHHASPLFNTAGLEDPILIAHGAKNPRVKLAETDEYVRRLQEDSVPVSYFVKYDEGRRFEKEENKIEFYEVMIGFLAKHNKTCKIDG